MQGAYFITENDVNPWATKKRRVHDARERLSAWLQTESMFIGRKTFLETGFYLTCERSHV